MQRGQHRVDVLCCAGVQVCGDLVGHQDFGPAQDRPCQIEPGGLAAGAGIVFPQNLVKTVRELCGKPGQAALVQRRPNLTVRV